MRCCMGPGQETFEAVKMLKADESGGVCAGGGGGVSEVGVWK